MKKKIKITKKQLERLKFWWSVYKQIECEYWKQVGDLERKISKDMGIEDIEIFHCNNEAVGIGNYNRTMELIQSSELDGI